MLYAVLDVDMTLQPFFKIQTFYKKFQSLHVEKSFLLMRNFCSPCLLFSVVSDKKLISLPLLNFMIMLNFDGRFGLSSLDDTLNKNILVIEH